MSALFAVAQNKQKMVSTLMKRMSIFIAVTYGFTWLVWLPLLANRQWHAGLPTFPGQFYLGSFGPLLGALTASLGNGGWSEALRWIRTAFFRRFPRRWLGYGLGLPLGYGLVAALVQRLVAGAWPEWHSFGLTRQLPGLNLGTTALVWVLTAGLGEESGWRGFLLPRLDRRLAPLTSAVSVAGLWLLWHLPAFWFDETYQGMGFAVLGWVISLMYGSVLLAWLCRGSRYSVLPVMLWHGGFNLMTAGDQAAPIMAMTCSLLVIAQGIFLSRQQARAGLAVKLPE